LPNLDVNNASFEYLERGSGEPLVLVHGSASDCRTWRLQRDEFGRHFRTIAYSRRHHWPNQPIAPGVDYSMAVHVDDLEALLLSQQATPAHLVAHSYGAFVALLLAIRAPQCVRTLVLAEPPVITLFVSNSPTPLEILRLLVTRPGTAATIIGFGITGLGPAKAAVRRGDMDGAMRVFGRATLGSEGPDTRRLAHHARGQSARLQRGGPGFPGRKSGSRPASERDGLRLQGWRSDNECVTNIVPLRCTARVLPCRHPSHFRSRVDAPAARFATGWRRRRCSSTAATAAGASARPARRSR